jgi:hypothetical protein
VPSSAEAPRDAVVRAIIELERSCLDADAALVERRWDGVAAALARQGALSAELGRLFAAEPQTAPAHDARVAQRLRGVLTYREDQLARLQAYRDEMGRRLQAVGKLRALSRTVGRHAPAASFYDTQQ